jgi:hypothetical protein
MSVTGRSTRALVAEQCLNDPQRAPRATRWVAEAWRRVGMEASLGRPLWRTTAVKVFWRKVGDRDVGRCRAGNTQGRDRPSCQDARHRCQVRSASGT